MSGAQELSQGPPPRSVSFRLPSGMPRQRQSAPEADCDLGQAGQTPGPSNIYASRIMGFSHLRQSPSVPKPCSQEDEDKEDEHNEDEDEDEEDEGEEERGRGRSRRRNSLGSVSGCGSVDGETEKFPDFDEEIASAGMKMLELEECWERELKSFLENLNGTGSSQVAGSDALDLAARQYGLSLSRWCQTIAPTLDGNLANLDQRQGRSFSWTSQEYYDEDEDESEVSDEFHSCMSLSSTEEAARQGASNSQSIRPSRKFEPLDARITARLESLSRVARGVRGVRGVHGTALNGQTGEPSGESSGESSTSQEEGKQLDNSCQQCDPEDGACSGAANSTDTSTPSLDSGSSSPPESGEVTPPEHEVRQWHGLGGKLLLGFKNKARRFSDMMGIRRRPVASPAA